jgi:hypothetical protein
MKLLTIKPLKPPKPRNPCVVPSLHRKAGLHRQGATSQRQTAAQHLRAELKHLHPPSR